MKKILFILTALEVGGIETYLLRFLKYSNQRIHATVICKSGRGGILQKEYELLGTEIVLQKLSFFSFIDYIKLYKFLKNEKFDVICDFTGDFAGLALLTAKIAKVERRIAFHRESKYQFNPTILKMTYARCMNYLVKKTATKILSNSQTALNEFHPGWQSKEYFYNVIYNGIPSFPEIDLEKKIKLRRELEIPLDAFIIGHVGRYTPAKNHSQIIKVAKKIIDKYPNVYFLLCGRGVNEGIGKEIIELGLQKQIKMPGSRDDISEVLQCLNAFYFPSLNEGQPNALLEAMSFGVPFVASNIDPIKESISEEFSEYLVSSNDIDKTVKLFSKYIQDELAFPSQRLSIWTREHYKVEKLFEDFIQQLIGVE